MNTANLDNSDFSLLGSVLGVFYTPTTASFDATGTTLKLRYTSLPEDNYTLTLFSGDGQFEDLVGWNLDGEPATFRCRPTGRVTASKAATSTSTFRWMSGQPL